MVAAMVDENTDKVFVRASWKWRLRGQKVRKLLKKAKRDAGVNISFHSDFSLAMLEFYTRYVVPHSQTEIVKK